MRIYSPVFGRCFLVSLWTEISPPPPHPPDWWISHSPVAVYSLSLSEILWNEMWLWICLWMSLSFPLFTANGFMSTSVNRPWHTSGPPAAARPWIMYRGKFKNDFQLVGGFLLKSCFFGGRKVGGRTFKVLFSFPFYWCFFTGFLPWCKCANCSHLCGVQIIC